MRGLRSAWIAGSAIMAATVSLFSTGTQTAVANGDTRTIYLYHAHNKDSIAATYLVNGRYDSNVLKQLNWFLRDWRNDETTTMDPRLFDVVWQVYREAGAGSNPITVLSAYRSPTTNAALRRRSRAVAKHSQHMLGKAMDTTMPGLNMREIREVGMKLQHGGVGWYPRSPFVHLDVGSVRSWPRMSYDQLVRLFPDGKTVHLPSNNQPLARYEEARAELEAQGNIHVPPSTTSKSFFAFLFGGGEDDDEGGASRGGRGSRLATRASRGRTEVAAYAPSPGIGDDGSRSFFLQEANRAQPAPVARAQRDLPRGETYMSPGPAAQPQPTQQAQVPQPQQQPAATPPPEPKVQTAALTPQPAAKPQPLDEDETKPPAGALAALAPLPPRRPTDLPTNLPEVLAFAPLPPVRPAEFARVAAYNAPLLRGLAAPKAADRTAAIPPLPPRREAVAPARLDRSNFGAMSAARPTSRVTTQTVLGAAIVAPRAAARARQSGMEAVGAPGRFGIRPAAPPTDRFAAPLGRQRAALTAAPRRDRDDD
ncbi:MAG: DUF882 domain-containing protein [Methylobacteriaceae bacterium]|nr:DUF882 domain-containing protein [Methylobacteriaceae bacterium]